MRLNAGDRVPSDGVIVECSDLTCNESALTGESEDKVTTIPHCISLHYTTLHYTILHYTTLRSTILHYPTLPYPTLPYTPQYCTTPHYTILHYTTLHFTALHSSVPVTLYLIPHRAPFSFPSLSILLCSALLCSAYSLPFFIGLPQLFPLSRS